ncbi:MAG: transglutaminase domain-containing protein [Candidatus Aenigmarchaeota archaeon]|nr:transglutaminase domain-containing protein [Candidatus Aenigmarchaeota archaeon]
MDSQKVILFLIIIVLLAGLAWELKYIEESLIMSTLNQNEQCEVLCSQKGEIAYVYKNSCYCKEPISFQLNWKCFWNRTFEEDGEYVNKFNASEIRNIAVKSVVKYSAPNAPATKIFGVHNEIANNIHYVSDPRRDEYVATPTETWDTQGGDCDDFSVLLASMYEAVGMDAKIVEVYNSERGHVFIVVKIEQDLDSFLKFYKTILERYTPYFSEKAIHIIDFKETHAQCEAFEMGLEQGENPESFYLIVESTTGDYPGATDAFQGYLNIEFIEVGE